MNFKKLFLAAFVAFIYLIVVNALFYPIFFPDGPPERYENPRPSPLFQYNLLALLITAFLMSYLYQLLYRGKSPWLEGLQAGVVMALFVSIPMSLHVYALVEIPFFVQFLPALWVTVIWGIAGIAIGLVHGKGFTPKKDSLSTIIS